MQPSRRGHPHWISISRMARLTPRSLRLIPDFSTVNSIFGECLEMAELSFGPREPHWNYTVRLRQKGGPETINDGVDQVLVFLSSRRSVIGYYFEAGHEVVHCLSPNILSGSATYLEEAIAAKFSMRVVHHKFGPEIGFEPIKYISADYRDAISRAGMIDPDIIRVGQRVRARYGSFSMCLTDDSIREIYPNAPLSVTRRVLERFPRQ